MTRFIEIQNKKENQLITTDELPLVVIFVDEEKHNLRIVTVEQYSNLDTSILCAYIAEDEGHLYFQPENYELTIFHNDNRINKSVWLKSGDVILLENKMIFLNISGDRIDINIIDKTQTKILKPPPIEQLFIQDQNNTDDFSDKAKELPEQTNREQQQKKTIYEAIKKKSILIFLGLVFIIALFMLFSESVSIEIEPEVSDVEIQGLLPTLKLNNRYIIFNGEYQIKANKEGYKQLKKTIKVDSSNNAFSFTMKENPGLVRLNINPDNNNEIYIDNILLGTELDSDNKLNEYEIEKGDYTLKIINPRYKVYEQSIRVEGKSKKQEFNPVLMPNWGVVSITSQPDEAVIIIKEKHTQREINEKNITPYEMELITGKYDIEVSKEKFKTKKITIDINAEEKLIIDQIVLVPEDAEVHVTSEPEEAILRINGTYIGKTPQVVLLQPNVENDIEISLTGYETSQTLMKFEAGEKKQLEQFLKPVTGTVFISTIPKQAKLYIDNQLQQTSSGRFIVSGKSKTFTVKADGYKTQEKTITINNYSKNINFHLQKQSNKADNKSVISSVKKTITKNRAKTSKDYKNSIGQKMIFMKGSLFTMGSGKNETGRRSNEPEHQVRLTYDFFLSEMEVTNEQYRKYKSEHSSGMSTGLNSAESLDLNRQPVVNISWDDAARFANWLSKKEGLSPYYKEENKKMVVADLKAKTDGYRLPFEAEWEYAARGNNQKKYPWGEIYPPQTVSGNFADESVRGSLSNVINNYDDQHRVSSPVGSFDANQSGFYDMGGNVSEWCQDYYSPNISPFSGNTITINPTGADKGKHKVVRDSSWKDSSISELRLSYRGYSQKAKSDIGFRLARYAK